MAAIIGIPESQHIGQENVNRKIEAEIDQMVNSAAANSLTNAANPASVGQLNNNVSALSLPQSQLVKSNYLKSGVIIFAKGLLAIAVIAALATGAIYVGIASTSIVLSSKLLTTLCSHLLLSAAVGLGAGTACSIYFSLACGMFSDSEDNWSSVYNFLAWAAVSTVGCSVIFGVLSVIPAWVP